jgi:hypothetical protein
LALKAPWPTEAKGSKGKGNERGWSKGKGDSSSGGEEGQGKNGGCGKSSKKTATTTEIKVKWKPGQTRKGEDILGYRPFEKTDRRMDKKHLTGCSFVIKKKGEPNPIALVSGEDIGRRAMDAYLNLPEEEKNDV